MYGLCWRKVQGFDRISSLYGLWDRDVFSSSRGISKLDMQRLSVKRQVACWERSFDELYLQHWMDRARWRYLHGVRGRKVQGVGRISLVQRLSVKLQLTCGELSFDDLRCSTGSLYMSVWSHDIHSCGFMPSKT